MLKRNLPKVIFFDAAGTLMFLPRPVGAHYAEVAASVGLKLDPMALDRAFHQAWKAMPPRSITRDGGAQPDDDKGWWRQLVRLVFFGEASAGLDGVLRAAPATFDFNDYFDVVYDHFARPGVWQAYPEVAGVLAKLRSRGVCLGVISNFDRRLFTNLEDIGLSAYFDHVTISSEVGADKPHGRIFERALAAFKVKPVEALHVGDDPVRDWAGAEAAGLGVFRLKRPENDLRALLIG
jgi:putative hydrolase of the HAD superfamily